VRKTGRSEKITAALQKTMQLLSSGKIKEERAAEIAFRLAALAVPDVTYDEVAAAGQALEALCESEVVAIEAANRIFAAFGDRINRTRRSMTSCPVLSPRVILMQSCCPGLPRLSPGGCHDGQHS
jgi:hypothetical protein